MNSKWDSIRQMKVIEDKGVSHHIRRWRCWNVVRMMLTTWWALLACSFDNTTTTSESSSIVIKRQSLRMMQYAHNVNCAIVSGKKCGSIGCRSYLGRNCWPNGKMNKWMINSIFILLVSIFWPRLFCREVDPRWPNGKIIGPFGICPSNWSLQLIGRATMWPLIHQAGNTGVRGWISPNLELMKFANTCQVQKMAY